MDDKNLFFPYKPAGEEKFMLCRAEIKGTTAPRSGAKGYLVGEREEEDEKYNKDSKGDYGERHIDKRYSDDILKSYFKYDGPECLICEICHRIKNRYVIDLNENTESILLGVFLATARKLRPQWKYKDNWASICATGDFVVEKEPDDELRLEAIGKHDEKFNGEFHEFAKSSYDGKQHLFLYIHKDRGLEKKSTENIAVKAFSPEGDEKNTVFDVLDYVFDLPPFPEPSDQEQKKLMDKFTKETMFAYPINGRYTRPGGYIPLRNSLLKEKPGRGFFFYGTGGGGKTAMTVQIARELLWNNSIYAPIMIRAGTGEIMKSMGPVGDASTIKTEDYLLQKLAEYLDKTPDQLDLSGHRYLIIIDNLDLSESYVKKFLSISNNFFKRFSNCIFIFTSRTRIESQSFGSLDLTAKAMPTFSSKEETEEFFRNAVVNEDYYKTKVASEIGTVNYNKFIDELHKKMNNLPGLILPYCRTELSLIGVDLVILTGKLRKNELSGNAQDMITEVYDNAFQKLSDDTKALLFLICSHGLIHRWTLNELEYWAKARVHRWKYDMNKLEPSIKELDYYMFIHEEVYDGKAYFYILPITYTTIYFEECFSNNGMREKIIGPHFMLVESLFFNGPRKMIRDCLDAMESYDESTRFVLDSRGHDMFEENKNPLHLAASYHDDPKVIDLVWEMHPEWYRPDDIGMTPLHYAALYSNSKAVMDRLLKINRDYLDNKDFRIATYDNGFNVVHMAAQNSQHEIMQTLLDYMEAHGMNYLMEQGTNGENQAPLHTAVSCSTNPLVVEALLRHGADVTRTCRGGYTPLAMAATFNAEPEVIETLVRFGADINHKNDHRQTPLIKAILQNPNDSICEKLLSCDGIDIDALTDKGRSALLLAADLNKVDCVRMLLDHGARVDQRNIAGDTALHCAVTRGATGAAKLLLEHGANPNLKNDGGFTPLDIASGMNNYDMVKLLLGTIQHDD